MIQKINILFMYFFIRYCPGGPDSDFEYSTQSYTGYEVQITLIDNVPMTLNNYFIISTFDINTRKCKWNILKIFQPTSMRAIRARYNPYLQTRHRVEQVRALNNDPNYNYYYQNIYEGMKLL